MKEEILNYEWTRRKILRDDAESGSSLITITLDIFSLFKRNSNITCCVFFATDVFQYLILNLKMIKRNWNGFVFYFRNPGMDYAELHRRENSLKFWSTFSEKQ